MKVTPKPVVQQRISGSAESHSRTLLKTRDLIDVSDEPTERGGTNEGFAPTEFLLAGLVACTNVVGHKVAAKHGIEIEAMEIACEATFDRGGVTLAREVDVPYPEIHLRIEVTTTASEEEMAIVERELPKFCAVSKVISESGTNIINEWIVKRPE